MTWIGYTASVLTLLFGTGTIIFMVINGRRVRQLDARTAATVLETVETLRETARIQAETRRILTEKTSEYIGLTDVRK